MQIPMKLEEQVIDLIAHHCGAKKEELKKKTLVVEDLGTTGDDAYELIKDLQQKFDIDLANFEFSLHFGTESGSNSNESYGYYPVSIEHLVDVCKKKEWFLPPKSEENYNAILKQSRQGKILLLIFIVVISLIAIVYESI